MEYGFVTEIDGVPVYRSNDDPKIEVQFKKGKPVKLKKKIKKLKEGVSSQ